MSEITLTGWHVLDEGRAMLRAAVAGVPADGWQRPTPCTEWNVAQVLQHAALDQRVWAAMLAGTEMPGENPFAPSGQLGARAAGLRRGRAGRVRAGLDGDRGDRRDSTDPAAAGADGARGGGRGSRAGRRDPRLGHRDGHRAGLAADPELAQALTPVAQSIVEPLRQYGAYAAALEPAAGADEAEALLCYLGRRPAWTA